MARIITILALAFSLAGCVGVGYRPPGSAIITVSTADESIRKALAARCNTDDPEEIRRIDKAIESYKKNHKEADVDFSCR